MADSLAERLGGVRDEIDSAARLSGRVGDDIVLVVVTKFHPASLIRELSALGVSDVGENRHQDAQPKAAQLGDLPLVWHFVGQLQSNKARAVLEYARVVHSVDRASLVTALGAVEKPVEVFLQLNLTDDPRRGGVIAEKLESLVESVLAQPTLRLRGLMAVAPLDSEPRRAFAAVRETSERIRRIAPDATALSMGMSGDFRDAILEGATHLRIGTAITGKRPEAG